MWTIDNADNELEADVDKSLLGSIFHELIQNSRACAENPARLFVSVDIHTESRPSADWLVFNFRDNGPGIPDSLKERIFENFFSQRSGMKTGTGLGLGFVRRVIAGHGGRIDEQGTRGDGAWFHIEMPRWFNETQNETQPFNLGAKT